MPETPTRVTCPTCRTTVTTNTDGTLRRHRRDGEQCPGGEVTQTLALPWAKPPLSLNDRHHWAVKARKTREARTVVGLLARKLQPVTGHALVTFHYRPRDDRRRDADNVFATVKPAIDGLRDAGILAEDSADLVTPQVQIHRAERGLPGCCWLSIEPKEKP